MRFKNIVINKMAIISGLFIHYNVDMYRAQDWKSQPFLQ
jgi:hypothetical protein